MTCGQSSYLVQEKEAGISPRGHHWMSPALEVEDTDDPPDLLELPSDLSAAINQTAAISVQRAAFGSRDQVTKRIYAVLMRHTN